MIKELGCGASLTAALNLLDKGLTENLRSAHHTQHSVCKAAIMEAMRNDWTDDRLDVFSRETYRRFDEVDRRFDEVDRRLNEADRNADRRYDEVNRRFDEVDLKLGEVDRRFGRVEGSIHDLQVEMNSRFEGMQRSMDSLHTAVLSLHRMMFRASVGVILALIAILATQL